MSEALRVNGTLTELNISSGTSQKPSKAPGKRNYRVFQTDIWMSADGARAFCEALQTNRALTTLYLNCEHKTKKQKKKGVA